jgi:hypothetical protein
MKLVYIRIYLALTTVEGIIALILLLAVPSETKSAVIFGYSVRKIVTAAVILIIDLLVGSLAVQTLIRRSWLEDKLINIDLFVEKGKNSFYIFLSPLIGAVVFCDLLILGKELTGGIVFFAINGAWYPLLWFFIIMIQTIILICILYIKIYINNSLGYKPILIIALVAANLFQWSVIINKLNVFTKLTNWFWKYSPIKHFSILDALFLVLVTGSLLLTWYLIKKQRNRWKALVILILWGVSLQFGFGMIDGHFPDPIIKKYSNSIYSLYAREAAKNPDLLNVIQNYEEIYGKSSSYTGTKPPGVMVFYITVEKIANMIHPLPTEETRFDYLLRFIGFVFPILSFLVIIPLYEFGCRLGGETLGVIACIIYIIFPNVLLMPLFLDEVLFPFLLVVGLLSVVVSIQKRSFWWAIITGVILFLSLFFTFSMLPVIFMAFLLTGIHFLHWWLSSSKTRTLSGKSLLEYIFLFAGLLVGIALTWIFFKVIFHYDLISRYKNAMEIQQQIKGGTLFNFSSDAWSNLVLANADFTYWTGYAPIILSLIAVWVAIRNLIGKRSTPVDWITISFWMMYILLNYSGTTPNETGRLWLFLTPVLAIMSASQTPQLFPQKKYGLYFVLLLQMITTYLLFHYNDFWT